MIHLARRLQLHQVTIAIKNIHFRGGSCFRVRSRNNLIRRAPNKLDRDVYVTKLRLKVFCLILDLSRVALMTWSATSDLDDPRARQVRVNFGASFKMFQ